MRTRRAFTLVELLVVVLIIALVSAVTLPVVVSAFSHRQVSESARLLQAAIEGARDSAIRANAPRGIRLIPDPAIPGSATAPNVPLAYHRIVPIEPAEDYIEGKVTINPGAHPATPYPNAAAGVRYPPGALRIEEAAFSPDGLPNARTNWFWNIRVGDRIRFRMDGHETNDFIPGQKGYAYTVVGPMGVTPGAGNPEQFVNAGPQGTPSPLVRTFATTSGNKDERVDFLYVVNGLDDDGDGYIDEGWDGVDNDGANGIDDVGEWEREAWFGAQAHTPAVGRPYTILRRFYPTQGARTIELPSNVVIDATTWDSTRERSRLPVDPNTLAVEIVVMPNGTILPTTTYSSITSGSVVPFLHFWLAERSDVMEPAVGAGVPYRLPMPKGTPGYDASATARYLKGDRRLVTVNTKTGNITTIEGEVFDGTNTDVPYHEAQAGIRAAD